MIPSSDSSDSSDFYDTNLKLAIRTIESLTNLPFHDLPDVVTLDLPSERPISKLELAEVCEAWSYAMLDDAVPEIILEPLNRWVASVYDRSGAHQ